MVTAILVAMIGNQVFPGHTGWWIAYCIFTALIVTLKFAWEQVK